MWTPVKLNSGKTEGYGFGWELGDIRGHRIIHHAGGWQGFTTQIYRYVDDKLTVIVMTNLAQGRPGKIARGLAALYEADLAPVERKAVQIDRKVFDDYVGEYELAPGFVAAISREGDRLWVQFADQERKEIFAESDTTFFVKGDEVQITFVKDASGTVTHLVLIQVSSQLEARKIAAN